MLLADVVALVESDYPPALASSWDAVGLVCGDPQAQVERVHLAVDPVEEVVDEALAAGAQLLLTHHPLYLRGTSSVAATTPKGRVVHRLIDGGCGLLVAHTNADHARPGVSDALAALFGLRDTRPLDPLPAPALDTLAVTVPVDDAARVRDALHEAGAGALGAYDRASWTSTGTGTFRPLEGARPALGEVGRLETVDEARVEVVLARRSRERVLAAVRAAHPYEEVAYDLHEHAPQPGVEGTGRAGELPEPLTLRELVERAAQVLPATAWGVRAKGDPDAVVTRLAVCGGAGDSLLRAAAASGAQAYLTSDLRHHPAAEAPEGLALLDAAHWATEWPWLPVAAQRLSARTGLSVSVSRLPTDPFCLSAPLVEEPARVKADPFAQLRLLDLQVLDSALARLAHRRRTLPELAEITRLDGLLGASADDLVRAETEASDLARETKKYEDEIALVRTRRTRNEERMASGAITQSKQLSDMEHENASLSRRQGELEDRELELMEKAEAVQEVLDRLVAERDERLAARAAAERARDAAWAEVDEEVTTTTAEREKVAAEIPADLLALYDKIRAAEGGVGAGEIRQRRCGGCRLDLMGNEIAEIRAASPDTVLRHEECGRIMVRTAESGL